MATIVMPNKGIIIGNPYPNPVEKYLYVPLYSEVTIIVQLQIRDTSGTLIKQKQYISQGRNILQILLDNIPSGTYHLEINIHDCQWHYEITKI